MDFRQPWPCALGSWLSPEFKPLSSSAWTLCSSQSVSLLSLVPYTLPRGHGATSCNGVLWCSPSLLRVPCMSTSSRHCALAGPSPCNTLFPSVLPAPLPTSRSHVWMDLCLELSLCVVNPPWRADNWVVRWSRGPTVLRIVTVSKATWVGLRLLQLSGGAGCLQERKEEAGKVVTDRTQSFACLFLSFF